jgi:hypothetical protein
MIEKTVDVQGEQRSVTGWKDAGGKVVFTDPGWSYNPGASSFISAKALAEKE